MAPRASTGASPGTAVQPHVPSTALRGVTENARKTPNASPVWQWARLAGTKSPSLDEVTWGRMGSDALSGAMGWGPDPALAGPVQC